MTAVDPQQYLEKAELIHSEQVVREAISAIAKQLNIDYARDSPLVLCVMTGGAFFTGQLLPQLVFQLNFDYLHATRYHGEQGSDIEWIVKPKKHISGQKVLILDDILDEGITLKTIIEECINLGATEVKVAVLVDKCLAINKPVKANYIGLTVPDRYVFGCGMDVYGWWRNLPAIYAL